jgi:hypothetical protein
MKEVEVSRAWGDRFRFDRVWRRMSVAMLGERRSFVEGTVFGLAHLDLLCRRYRACMVCVAVDLEVTGVNANDRAADTPGLGIPAHVIANRELARHRYSIPIFAPEYGRNLHVGFLASFLRPKFGLEQSRIVRY